jgi:hypothetical protein
MTAFKQQVVLIVYSRKKNCLLQFYTVVTVGQLLQACRWHRQLQPAQAQLAE